jgi:hypothetical protein
VMEDTIATSRIHRVLATYPSGKIHLELST